MSFKNFSRRHPAPGAKPDESAGKAQPANDKTKTDRAETPPADPKPADKS